jgi:hypothetical protein
MLSGGTTPYDLEAIKRAYNTLNIGKYSTGVGFERQPTSWVLPDTIILADNKKISKELFTKVIDKLITEYFPEEYL